VNGLEIFGNRQAGYTPEVGHIAAEQLNAFLQLGPGDQDVRCFEPDAPTNQNCLINDLERLQDRGETTRKAPLQ
jgi:hypothetical protein